MNDLKNPPVALEAPEAVFWTRDSIEKSTSWKHAWPETLLRSLQATFKELGDAAHDLEKLPPDSIRNPELITWAGILAREIREGTGFVLISAPSLPLSEKELRFCYLALGWALGPTVERYGRLYDVVDQGDSYTEKRIPVSQTHSETQFHTDSSARSCLPEVVALLCIRPAQKGGESQLVSAMTACREIARTRPSLYQELFRPLIRNIVTPGTDFNLENLRANRIPVLERNPGRFKGLAFRYMRYWIEKGHEQAAEPLSPESLEALDVLDRELTHPDHVLEFTLQAGEMLFIHNLRLAHNRRDFFDPPGKLDERRCMVRMWLTELA